MPTISTDTNIICELLLEKLVNLTLTYELLNLKLDNQLRKYDPDHLQTSGTPKNIVDATKREASPYVVTR